MYKEDSSCTFAQRRGLLPVHDLVTNQPLQPCPQEAASLSVCANPRTHAILFFKGKLRQSKTSVKSFKVHAYPKNVV